MRQISSIPDITLTLVTKSSSESSKRFVLGSLKEFIQGDSSTLQNPSGRFPLVSFGVRPDLGSVF